MTTLRQLVIGGVLSFRALFAWLNPAVYLSTVVVKPVLQLLFFALLGRYSAVADDRYFVVGNAIQACAISGVFGMVTAVANEREFGTLPAVLATPANRVVLFLGRAIPVTAVGLSISTLGVFVGCLVLGVSLPPGALAPLLGLGVLTALSCALFGLALGAVALRTRDIWAGSNLVFYLMLLLCGGSVPASALPGWLAAAGRLLPLTHGIEAARAVVAGQPRSTVVGLAAGEAAVGLAYAVLGVALLRLFEWEGRRRATLEIT
jgi:ABC-2 type transport system permease protein